MKFYYGNVLSSQNITAKPNVTWVTDITEIELHQNKKLYIFLCVDIDSNIVIAHTISQKTIKSCAICLTKAIEKRFSSKSSKKVIVHTDRGTQFSSKAYNDFRKHFEAFIIPSMSGENTPTDNTVTERFMRTVKEHEIKGKVIEQTAQESVMSGEKSFRSIINIYIKSLNKRPNRKSLLRRPHRHEDDLKTASILMSEPKYHKAFSEQFGHDDRRDKINNYKSQASEVVSILEELAARKAELVYKTPFDLDDNLVLELVDKRLMELYNLIQNNPLVIRKYVNDAIESVREDVGETNENIQELQDEFREEMEILNEKIDRLLPKEKKDRQTQLLRAPIDNNLFHIFFTNAGIAFQRRKRFKKSSTSYYVYNTFITVGYDLMKLDTLFKRIFNEL